MIMELLKERLEKEGCSCVIAKGDTVRCFHQRGVADLYHLVCNEPDFLNDAYIADKVVGKAAASLMIRGGIKALYTKTVSEYALNLLKEHEVAVSFDNVVPNIINRSKTDWCPLEKLCKDETSIDRMFALISDFVESKV